MAITVSVLTEGVDTDGGASSTTASITPTANTLLLLTVCAGHTTANTVTAPSAVAGNGLTWVKVNERNDDTSTWKTNVSVWRAMGAAPSAGALTISFSGTAPLNCLWQVAQFSGVDTSGTNGSGAIGASATGEGNDTVQADVGSPAATSALFGATTKNDTAAVPTAGTGYTELGTKATDGSPSIQRYIIYDIEAGAGHDGIVDVSWGLASSKTSIVAVEILAAAEAPPPAPPPASPIAYRSSSVNSSGAATSTLEIAKPAGVVNGDLMLAFVVIGADQTVSAAPSGWTLLSEQTTGTATGDCRHLCYWRTASSEGASYTWTFSAGVDNAGVILAYQNVNATPIHAAGVNLMVGSTLTHTGPSVTLSTPNTMLVHAFGVNPAYVGNLTFTTPTGTTPRAEADPGEGGSGIVSYLGGRSFATPSGVDSISIDVPSGIIAGDVLIANLHSAYTTISHSPGNGWTLLEWREEDYGSNPLSNDPRLTGGKDLGGIIFYKVADGSETSVTFPFASVTDAHRFASGTITAWRNVDTASPIYDVEVNGQTTGNQVDCPSIDGLSGGALICSFHKDDKETMNSVTGMTTVASMQLPEPGADDYHLVTYQLLSSTGATGVKTSTYIDEGDGIANDMGWSLTLRPGSGTSTTNRAVLATFEEASSTTGTTSARSTTINDSGKGVAFTIALASTDAAPATVVIVEPATSTAIAAGCMLGFYDTKGTSVMNTIEGLLDTKFAVVRVYHDPPSFPTIKSSTITALTNQNRLVMSSHKPPKRGGAWIEIHRGDHSASIDAWVTYYKSLAPAKVIFILHHEPHDDTTDLKATPGLFGTAADFVKAFRYIGKKFRDANADNVYLGYCAVANTWANKKASGSTIFGSGDKCYPGDDMVDVLCHDEYNTVGEDHNPTPGDFSNFTGSSWHSFQEEYEDTVALAKQLNKPLIMGEIGCQHSTPLGDRGDWFRDGAYWLEHNEDAKNFFKGFCYYHVDNHDGSGHWWRFTNDTDTTFKGDGQQGYIDGFSTNPYFKTTPIDVITENVVTSSIQIVGIQTGFQPGSPTVTLVGGKITLFNAGGVAAPSDYDVNEEEAGVNFGTASLAMGDPLFLVAPLGLASEEAFGEPIVEKHTGQGWIFTPPVRYNNPGVLPRTREYQRALFKYFRGAPVQSNVYVMLDGTVTEAPDPLLVAKIYYGGHVNVITDEEEAILRAAGYGDSLTIIL